MSVSIDSNPISSAPSVSARQLRANRRNAKHSTGPRTDEGKARAAKNALAHGIFCKELLTAGEDAAELAAFCELLLAALGPRDFLERTIAQQYVEAKWRIRRVRRAERDAHDLLAGTIETFDGRAFLDLRRRLRDLPRLESLRPGDHDPRPRGDDPRGREDAREQRYADRRALVPVSATMAQSFIEESEGTFERLSRYEHRLEMSADRALRQLRQLRKDRGPDWTPPEEIVETAVDPTPADDAPSVQNEPISDQAPASPDGVEACAQRSCNIEPVAPTKVPSAHRGLGVPPEHFNETAPRERSGETPKPRKERERS